MTDSNDDNDLKEALGGELRDEIDRILRSSNSSHDNDEEEFNRQPLHSSAKKNSLKIETPFKEEDDFNVSPLPFQAEGGQFFRDNDFFEKKSSNKTLTPKISSLGVNDDNEDENERFISPIPFEPVEISIRNSATNSNHPIQTSSPKKSKSNFYNQEPTSPTDIKSNPIQSLPVSRQRPREDNDTDNEGEPFLLGSPRTMKEFLEGGPEEDTPPLDTISTEEKESMPKFAVSKDFTENLLRRRRPSEDSLTNQANTKIKLEEEKQILLGHFSDREILLKKQNDEGYKILSFKNLELENVYITPSGNSVIRVSEGQIMLNQENMIPLSSLEENDETSQQAQTDAPSQQEISTNSRIKPSSRVGTEMKMEDFEEKNKKREKEIQEEKDHQRSYSITNNNNFNNEPEFPYPHLGRSASVMGKSNNARTNYAEEDGFRNFNAEDDDEDDFEEVRQQDIDELAQIKKESFNNRNNYNNKTRTLKNPPPNMLNAQQKMINQQQQMNAQNRRRKRESNPNDVLFRKPGDNPMPNQQQQQNKLSNKFKVITNAQGKRVVIQKLNISTNNVNNFNPNMVSASLSSSPKNGVSPLPADLDYIPQLFKATQQLTTKQPSEKLLKKWMLNENNEKIPHAIRSSVNLRPKRVANPGEMLKNDPLAVFPLDQKNPGYMTRNNTKKANNNIPINRNSGNNAINDPNPPRTKSRTEEYPAGMTSIEEIKYLLNHRNSPTMERRVNNNANNFPNNNNNRNRPAREKRMSDQNSPSLEDTVEIEATEIVQQIATTTTTIQPKKEPNENVSAAISTINVEKPAETQLELKNNNLELEILSQKKKMEELLAEKQLELKNSNLEIEILSQKKKMEELLAEKQKELEEQSKIRKNLEEELSRRKPIEKSVPQEVEKIENPKISDTQTRNSKIPDQQQTNFSIQKENQIPILNQEQKIEHMMLQNMKFAESGEEQESLFMTGLLNSNSTAKVFVDAEVQTNPVTISEGIEIENPKLISQKIFASVEVQADFFQQSPPPDDKVKAACCILM